MYKAIIFDFFGVFCPDTSFEWLKEATSDYESKMDEYSHLCALSDYGRLAKEDFYKDISALAGTSPADAKAGIEAKTIINTKLVDFVRQLQPTYKIACLSNGTNEWATEAIENNDLSDLFDKVILSGDLGVRKPEPGIYRKALKILNVDPDEAIFIDDKETNTEAAEALGIKSILFKNTDDLINNLRVFRIEI